MSETAIPQVAAESLLTAFETAKLLHCSERTIWRAAEVGAMPAPVRILGLRRWRRCELSSWISAGCPSVKGADHE
jgi:predicted DNA-binding transcriptional regulator AlpA